MAAPVDSGEEENLEDLLDEEEANGGTFEDEAEEAVEGQEDEEEKDEDDGDDEEGQQGEVSPDYFSSHVKLFPAPLSSFSLPSFC